MNFTKKNLENHLSYLNKNLDYPFYTKSNTEKAINFVNYRLHEKQDLEDETIREIFKFVLIKITRNLKKIKISNLHQFYLKYLEYLSDFTDYKSFIIDMIEDYYKSNLKVYSHIITRMLGNIIGKKIRFKKGLVKFTFEDFKTKDPKHIICYTQFFLLYLRYFEKDTHNLTDDYRFIVVRYLNNLDNIYKERDIIDILIILGKLVRTFENKIEFLKYCGFERISKLKGKYNSYAMMSQLNSLRFQVTGHSTTKTSSLHQLCKYKDNVEQIKFIIYNSNINYNIIDSCNRTPFYFSLKKFNKGAIEFFISSGIDINKKKLDKNINHLYNLDPLFMNVIQKAFIKRKYNLDIVKKVISSYKFYDVINDIIFQYVDVVHEYIKNQDIIQEICDKKGLTNITTSTHVTRLLNKGAVINI